jgi:hypothetical protein
VAGGLGTTEDIALPIIGTAASKRGGPGLCTAVLIGSATVQPRTGAGADLFDGRPLLTGEQPDVTGAGGGDADADERCVVGVGRIVLQAPASPLHRFLDGLPLTQLGVERMLSVHVSNPSPVAQMPRG